VAVREATRRGVLAAAAASLPMLVPACKGVGALGTPPRPLPDVAVARQAIAAETLMIARYRAVLARLPSLAAQLRPLLGQHQQHLERLRERLIVPPAAARRATAGPAASGASPGPVTAPATPAAALAYLAGAEDAAAAALLAHLGPVSASFAQLLASIAACESSHALLLHHPRGVV
jgi:hypothetical protein